MATVISENFCINSNNKLSMKLDFWTTCNLKLKAVKKQYNFIQEQIWWGQLNHQKPSNWLLHSISGGYFATEVVHSLEIKGWGVGVTILTELGT